MNYEKRERHGMEKKVFLCKKTVGEVGRKVQENYEWVTGSVRPLHSSFTKDTPSLIVLYIISLANSRICLLLTSPYCHPTFTAVPIYLVVSL